MTYSPEFRHRRSIRAKGYDYSQPGSYFITICTWEREAVLGDVVGGEMRVNEIGASVHDVWQALPERFPGVVLDAFVVMPNHVHGVMMLGSVPEGTVGVGRPGRVVGEKGRSVGEPGRASPAPTGLRDSNTPDVDVATMVGAGLALPGSPTAASPDPTQTTEQPSPPRPVTLGAVVGAFKSLSAIGANRLLGRSGAPFWQRNYYEHIVRTDAALDRIRAYIANNPANWATDEENPLWKG